MKQDSFSPFSRRGGRKESQGGGENKKAFLILKAESEGFTVFPRTLSVEELGCVQVPGQVSWLSGHHRILSLPILREAKQWLSVG
jgi:hypothetical protein